MLLDSLMPLLILLVWYGHNVIASYCFFRYSEALMELLSKLLCKLQLRYNEAQLEELEDDDDDKGDTKTVIVIINIYLLSFNRFFQNFE